MVAFPSPLSAVVTMMMKKMMMSVPPVCTLKVVHQQIQGLIYFNEMIIGLISIHLVQRPADTKHEERLRNTLPPPSTTGRIPPCGGAAAPSAASTVSSIQFGGSGLR